MYSYTHFFAVPTVNDIFKQIINNFKDFKKCYCSLRERAREIARESEIEKRKKKGRDRQRERQRDRNLERERDKDKNRVREKQRQ